MKALTILIIIIATLIIWSLYSFIPLRNIEEPNYTVTEKKDGYEIRQYDAYIIATTDVAGNYRDGLSEGFRIIAGYIFGGNTSQEKLAMTIPVTESSSEKIAMTAPVLEGASGEGNENDVRSIAFVMPSSYTLDTLPIPNDDRVQLIAIPERTVAVRKFGWYAYPKRIATQKEKLRESLERDDIEAAGDITTAYYNQPFSMPLFLRNEIMLKVEIEE